MEEGEKEKKNIFLGVKKNVSSTFPTLPLASLIQASVSSSVMQIKDKPNGTLNRSILFGVSHAAHATFWPY